MRLRKNIISPLLILMCGVAILCWIFYPDKASSSGPYTDSAHGSSSYGVNRTSLSTFGYSIGNCAHCHEQHASIGGSEPAPTGGPDNYELFYANHVSQTDNFCYKCHTDLSSYQTGGLINRSYSYRAGGYTSDTLNDILEAFSFTSPSSSHDLDDISTFITSQSWGYTADSNPCCACHNPHRAQGDPANAPSSAKTSGTRGWPVSRPSQHSKDNNAWGLWGDNLPTVTERMSNYTANYQAPYRCGNSSCTTTPSSFEPQGDTISSDAAANTTDFVTFCQDCHSSSMTGSPYNLSHTPIKWDGPTTGDASTAGDKHGKNNATTNICIDPPYNSTSSCTTSGLGKVLSCTDCHEPHGAPNNFLIRKEVNGGVLSGTVSTGTKDYGYLCRQCHMDDYDYNSSSGTANRWEAVHHCAGDSPYNESMCGSCHGSGSESRAVCGGGGGMSISPIKCSNCHYHGSYVTDADNSPATRRTF